MTTRRFLKSDKIHSFIAIFKKKTFTFNKKGFIPDCNKVYNHKNELGDTLAWKA